MSCRRVEAVLAFRVEKCCLKVGGTTVEFGTPIAQVVEAEGVLCVRIDSPIGSQDNRNVFGVSEEGVVVWQVPGRKHVYPDSPYTNVTVEAGAFLLGNWDGLELTVDPATGAVMNEGYVR